MKYKDNFQTETFFTIDYYDLDDIIREEYNDPDFECSLDQSNGSYIKMGVNGEFDKYKTNGLRLYLENKRQEYNTLGILMNDLCRKGMIEKGEYLIYVSW